jgi:hypothetical protein
VAGIRAGGSLGAGSGRVDGDVDLKGMDEGETRPCESRRRWMSWRGSSWGDAEGGGCYGRTGWEGRGLRVLIPYDRRRGVMV